MDKICEKCGNVIPEGMDVCPNCGRETYDDADLQGVLRDLERALDGGTREQAVESFNAGEIQEVRDAVETTDEPTIRIPNLSEDDFTERSEGKDTQEASIHKLIEASQTEHTHREAPRGKDRKEPSGTSQKKRAPAGGPNRKKPPKKKNSAAAIGVVIGLIIALLIIACGVAFMLYQMGFFVSMSDDELLQTSAVETSVQPSPTAEEPSAAEESETPVEKTSAMEEVPEITDEPEEAIVCEQFELIGSEYIILYSRGVTMEMPYFIEPEELSSEIEWESSNELVATVDDFGVVRARRGGETKITGTCGDKSISAYVTCDFTVPDTVLDMNMEDITMSYEGQTVELFIDYELTKEQEDATVWESSDPAVATVNEEGVVTAVSNGTAVITASIAEYTASCIVRCVDVTGTAGYNSDESEYVINYEDVTLTRKGEYFQLTLQSVLGNEMPDFTWTSDDPAVATVDNKGVVTAVSDGTAYITTTIGADKFRCIVRVHISD